jgi:hypothetical protein
MNDLDNLEEAEFKVKLQTHTEEGEPVISYDYVTLYHYGEYSHDDVKKCIFEELNISECEYEILDFWEVNN